MGVFFGLRVTLPAHENNRNMYKKTGLLQLWLQQPCLCFRELIICEKAS